MKLYQVPVESVREADLDTSDDYRYITLNCETMVTHSDAKGWFRAGIAMGFGLGGAFVILLVVVL